MKSVNLYAIGIVVLIAMACASREEPDRQTKAAKGPGTSTTGVKAPGKQKSAVKAASPAQNAPAQPDYPLPEIASLLSAEHTFVLAGAEDLGELSREVIALIEAVPAPVRSKMLADDAPAWLPALFESKARNELLGFDPTQPQGWREIGIDSKSGIAFAVDTRFAEEGHPRPILLAKVTDRNKLIATIGRLGLKVELAPDGRSASVDGHEVLLGDLLGWTTVLWLDGDAAQLKPRFEAILGKAASPLDRDTKRAPALAMAPAGPRVFGYFAGHGIAPLAKNEDTKRWVEFYDQRFPGLGMAVSPSGGGLRLLGDGPGVDALKKVLVPAAKAPAFARFVPQELLAGRLSFNLVEIFDGLRALIPPHRQDVQGKLLIGKNLVAMGLGVSLESIRASLTGHFVLAFGPQTPGTLEAPSILLLAGIADPVQADATFARWLKHAEGSAVPVEVAGHKVSKLRVADVTYWMVRKDKVLLVASTEALLAKALGEASPLGKGHAARYLDGAYALSFVGHIEAYRNMIPPEVIEFELLREVWRPYTLDEALVLGIKVDERGLFVGGPGREGVLAGALPAILAAVAIPAFLKYIKRAKVAEAQSNLLQIARAAELSLAEERIDKAGRRVPARLPASAPLTPTVDACSQGQEAYESDAATWKHATWRALSFEITGKHHYRYALETDPTKGTFTARAVGDLDCDGIQSIFEIIDPKQPMRITNELE